MDVGRRSKGSLAGVRALLLDMDGVLVSRGRPIAGAEAAIERLKRARVPLRIVTNTSLHSRANLARRLERAGIAIAPECIVTALSATIDRLRERGSSAAYLLGSSDAVGEFARSGIRLLSGTELDEGVRADVVVIGDSEDQLTYENLNRAFRQIRAGAEFVAMHRNPWWLTAAGPTLDSGSLVVGLEYATGRRAQVAGKPSPTFFRAAVADLAHEVRGRLRRDEVAMVGDDLSTDLLPAHRLGLRTALVLTGKHHAQELTSAAERARPFVPDGVFESIGSVVDGLIGSDRPPTGA